MAKLDEWAHVIHEETARQKQLRVVLYENAKRITDTFSQRLPNVVQRATDGELTAEVSGGIAAIVAAKGSAKVGTTETVEVTPLMQALMLEEAASRDRWLVELGDRAGEAGDPLLRFVGNGCIVAPGQPVPDLPEFGLTNELAARVQARRAEQEAWMRTMDPELPGTFVLLAGGAGPVCSIASLRQADVGGLASYASMPPFGILGLFEGRTEALTFVAPLMIWRDAGVALDAALPVVEAFTGLLDVKVKARGVVDGDDNGYPVVTVRNGGQAVAYVESIVLDAPREDIRIAECPLMRPDIAPSLGIDGMFKRLVDLPAALQPGESARWPFALYAESPLTLADVTLVVRTSTGQEIRRPLMSD